MRLDQSQIGAVHALADAVRVLGQFSVVTTVRAPRADDGTQEIHLVFPETIGLQVLRTFIERIA